MQYSEEIFVKSKILCLFIAISPACTKVVETKSQTSSTQESDEWNLAKTGEKSDGSCCFVGDKIYSKDYYKLCFKFPMSEMKTNFPEYEICKEVNGIWKPVKVII